MAPAGVTSGGAANPVEGIEAGYFSRRFKSARR